MKQKINILWFKRDLRLVDNEALLEASKSNIPLLLLYVMEPSLYKEPHYSDRHWRFVIESIYDLNNELKPYNTKIYILYSEVTELFNKLLEENNIEEVFSTEETGIDLTFRRDINFSKFCKLNGIIWREFRNGGVLRGLKNRKDWRQQWYAFMGNEIEAIDLSKIKFLNLENSKIKKLEFTYKFMKEQDFQKGGRSEGKEYENSFFEERIQYYSDYISKPQLARIGCSRLSPYFAWGCISVREVYQRSMQMKKEGKYRKQLTAFNSRLRWQSHFIQKFEMEPRIEFEAFNRGYLDLDQPINDKHIKAWKSGTTGFPLVDASIRAVIHTGYLNFRMRSMIVSFLLHHLFQHFTTGSAWLARQFLDFEPGIHYAQFQMQAGFTGTNTIRIYNPTKNALDHDPEAVFIKKWVPELRGLPPELAIEPWMTTEMEKELYNFYPGKDYPEPIVNIKETRKHTLQELYGLRKNDITQKERQRILDVHTLQR